MSNVLPRLQHLHALSARCRPLSGVTWRPCAPHAFCEYWPCPLKFPSAAVREFAGAQRRGQRTRGLSVRPSYRRSGPRRSDVLGAPDAAPLRRAPRPRAVLLRAAGRWRLRLQTEGAISVVRRPSFSAIPLWHPSKLSHLGMLAQSSESVRSSGWQSAPRSGEGRTRRGPPDPPCERQHGYRGAGFGASPLYAPSGTPHVVVTSLAWSSDSVRSDWMSLGGCWHQRLLSLHAGVWQHAAAHCRRSKGLRRLCAGAGGGWREHSSGGQCALSSRQFPPPTRTVSASSL